MILTFYNKNLEITGSITRWKSLYFSNTYNTMGSFVLEISAQNNASDFYRLWEYCIIDYDNDNVYIITSANVVNKSIVLTGFPATYIFSKRASVQVVGNEKAETAMHKVVQTMSPWDNLIVDDEIGYTDVYNHSMSDSSVLDYLQSIGEASDMGFRVVKRGSNLVFKCFKPTLNTSVKYSTSLKNVANLDYLVNENDFYNTAIVAGAGEGENRITVVAYKTLDGTIPQGTERREIYVDARNEQPKENETDSTYKNRLKKLGLKKLAKMNKTENLSFFIANDDSVALGDVIDVYLEEYKIYIRARVVEVETINEGNTTVKTIQVGTPIKVIRSVTK